MSDLLEYAKRARRKPRQGEHQAQVQLFQLISMHPILRDEPITAVPNGGQRHPAVAAKLKAEGVRPGVPDILWFRPRGGYAGLAIEMKHGKNKPTPEQRDWLAALKACRWRTAVCYSAGEAWQLMLEYWGWPARGDG